MICEYIKPSFLEEVNSHFPYLQGEWVIGDATYQMLPTPLAKEWVWEENLKNGNQLEVNQFTLVCFVLALRYFKSYKIEIKPIEDETILKMNRRVYYLPKLTHAIFLGDDILAFQTSAGMFYTDSELIRRHKKTLGFYCENLKEAPFCLRLNTAEKHLFSIWLSNIKYLNQDSHETYIQVIKHIFYDLEPCKLKFDEIIQAHFFCDMLDNSCLPAGMDLTVSQYEKIYTLSDLFLEGTSGLNDYQYILLDKSILNNCVDKDSFTVLNHIRYFELQNHNEVSKDLLWCISHYYRQKVDNNIQFICEIKQFFLRYIYRIEKNSVVGSIVSEDNLLLDQYLYFFPFQSSILDIYEFDQLSKRVKLGKTENEIQLYFQWRLSKIHVVSSIVFRLKNQVIDILNNSIEVKLMPEYKIKNLKYYELRYKTINTRYSLSPIKYDEEIGNYFTAQNLMDLHGLYDGINYCGFFKTYHSEIENNNHEKTIDVKLRFYSDRVIYSYNTEITEDNKGYNNKKEIHNMYYKMRRRDTSKEIHPDMYQYLDLNTTSYDDLELINLNIKENSELVMSYHWDFDGTILFRLSEKDIKLLIWNIFIDLITQGYQRKNIYWDIQYHNIKENVNNRIFEQLIKKIISDISLLKKVDDGKQTEQDDYESKEYSTYNIQLNSAGRLMKKLTDNAGYDIAEVQMIYMSDQAIFEDNLHLDLSIQAKYRKKYPDGLLSVLKLLADGQPEILELYGLEFFMEEFTRFNKELFRGLVIYKLENIAFRSNHPWFEKATQELIYMMTCLVLNAVIEVYEASQLNKQIKHIIINFDVDSILYRMLKRLPFYEAWLQEFGKMLISKINIDSVFIGDDFQDNSYTQIRRNDKDARVLRKANDSLTTDIMEYSAWVNGSAFPAKVNEMVHWGKMEASKKALIDHFMNNPSYIRDHVSQIKNQIISNFFDIELNGDDTALSYPFIGNKTLAFIKNGNINGDEKLAEDLFEVIHWGEGNENNGVFYIMILPAVLEKNLVVERGVIIFMDESVYTVKPLIGENDFKSLNYENAKTVERVTQHMFEMIEKTYINKNIDNQKKIDQLQKEMAQSNTEVDNLQRISADLNARIQLIEEDKLNLEKEYILTKELNSAKDKQISLLENCDYRNVIISDYNRYLASPLSKDSFFKKYKRVRVTSEFYADQIRFRRSIFHNSNTFIIVEVAQNTYLIFPDKKCLYDPEYESLMSKIYKMTNEYKDGEQSFKIIQAAIVNKQADYFTLSLRGVFEKLM